MNESLDHSLSGLKNVDSFSNKTVQCVAQRRTTVLVLAWFGTIFFGEIEQTTTTTTTTTTKKTILPILYGAKIKTKRHRIFSEELSEVHIINSFIN